MIDNNPSVFEKIVFTYIRFFISIPDSSVLHKKSIITEYNPFVSPFRLRPCIQIADTLWFRRQWFM